MLANVAGDEDQPATKGELRQLGALIENVDGHVRTLAEGFGAVDAKVERLGVGLRSEMHEIRGELRAAVETLSDLILKTSSTRQVDELAGRVTVVERDVAELKTRPPTPPPAASRKRPAAAKRPAPPSRRKKSAR